MRQIHTAIETNHGVSFPLVGVGRFQQKRSACDDDTPIASTDDDEVPDSNAADNGANDQAADVPADEVAT